MFFPPEKLKQNGSKSYLEELYFKKKKTQTTNQPKKSLNS